ncbi:MAG: TrkA family potassium uptake protein [Halodesulfurarchaeum sp.]
MRHQRRRLFVYVASVAVIVSGYTLAYVWAMGALEGRPRTFLDGLLMVVETFTTVGYGEDAPWEHPITQVLVIAMQLSGILLVFAALPLVLVPYLEDRLSISAPTSISASDHVIVCGFSSRGRTLIEELVADDVEYVVVAPEATATDLVEDGYRAMAGDPESIDALERAQIGAARAVIIDAGDETNAAIALAIQEVDPAVETISFVENPGVAEYLEYAGVDRVLSPRNLLARALADRVTSALTTSMKSAISIADDFDVVEMPVGNGCELEGQRLRDSGIRERTGVDVIGAWRDGDFLSSPGPSFTIDSDTILVVAGPTDGLAELKRLTLPDDHGGPEQVVIAGYGRVGRTARERLEDAGLSVTVIDTAEAPGVDIVGDATERGTLRDADLEDADALVTALPDDTDTIFTTLVAGQVNPEIEIFCRAENEERVDTIYGAGADSVIALATVSGRMLAASLLDEEVIGLETQIEVIRVQTDSFAGQSLADADIRARTGCTVVAVERDGTLITGPEPTFTFEAEDTLIVAGTDEDIDQFNDVAAVGAVEPH